MNYRQTGLFRTIAASLVFLGWLLGSGSWPCSVTCSPRQFCCPSVGVFSKRSTALRPAECDLSALLRLFTKPNPDDQRIVRTTAILIAGYEQWFLYSPRCNRQDNFVWLENEPDTRSKNAIDKRLKSLLAAKSSKYAAGRAQITVVGRFIGPGGKRFGHLDRFRMKFVAIRVEQARSVFPHTSWPVTNGATGDVDEAEQTIRSINKEFVFHLAGSPTYSAIPSEFFAADFRFTDPNGNQTKAEFLATSVTDFPG